MQKDRRSLLHVVMCREFTLNMISEWFLEAANHTCGNYDRAINEIELAGLTPMPSVRVSTSPDCMRRKN